MRGDEDMGDAADEDVRCDYMKTRCNEKTWVSILDETGLG